MDQACIGRIAKEPALFQQLGGVVCLFSQAGEDGMVRFPGLDEKKAGGAPPSAAAAELFQELDGVFVGPEVLLPQDIVGLDDCHQRHAGKVKALCNYLCANQNVNFSLGKLPDGPGLRLGGVAVQPRNTGPGIKGLQLFLDFLGAGAQWLQGASAVVTLPCIGLCMAAIMAHQAFRVNVQAQGNVAVRTLGNGAAFGALDGGRIRAAGAQQYGLPAGVQRAGKLL